ncbi:MAG: hypothetical protein QXO47_10430 [Thermoproteota archaeon]
MLNAAEFKYCVRTVSDDLGVAYYCCFKHGDKYYLVLCPEKTAIEYSVIDTYITVEETINLLSTNKAYSEIKQVPTPPPEAYVFLEKHLPKTDERGLTYNLGSDWHDKEIELIAKFKLMLVDTPIGFLAEYRVGNRFFIVNLYGNNSIVTMLEETNIAEDRMNPFIGSQQEIKAKLQSIIDSIYRQKTKPTLEPTEEEPEGALQALLQFLMK